LSLTPIHIILKDIATEHIYYFHDDDDDDDDDDVLMQLTNSTEQSPSWNGHLTSQEIPHLFWNARICYGVHRSPPLNTILSQKNSIHIYTPYF